MGPRRTTAPEAAGGWATRHPPRASSPRGRRGSGVTADPRDRSRADPAGYTAHARMIPNVRRYSLGRHSAKATRRLRLPPEGPDGPWDDGRLVGQPDGLEFIRADRLAAQAFDEPRRAIGDRVASSAWPAGYRSMRVPSGAAATHSRNATIPTGRGGAAAPRASPPPVRQRRR